MAKSKEQENTQEVTTQDNTALAVREDKTELEAIPQAQPISEALALQMHEEEALFNELIAQVEIGFIGTKPSKVFERGEAFNIIDATTIENFVDKRTGEESAKHKFVLEYPESNEVVVIMQSDAAPRRAIATLFKQARRLQKKVVITNVKLVEMDTKQINAALVFERQQGSRLLQLS